MKQKIGAPLEAFPCIKCGICCKNLHKNNLYNLLNRGDGICKNFNEIKNLCNIYEKRPSICRIMEIKKTLFQEMATKVYIQKNIEACRNAGAPI